MLVSADVLQCGERSSRTCIGLMMLVSWCIVNGRLLCNCLLQQGGVMRVAAWAGGVIGVHVAALWLSATAAWGTCDLSM